MTPVLFTPIPLNLKEIVFALAVLNVGLAVLSLIPANPLDGYKVIIGLLWSALGSQAVAQQLVRRAGILWVAVELIGTSILLVERPFLGATVIAIGASLFGQNLFTRRRA
jgi:Zn-dependent protease